MRARTHTHRHTLSLCLPPTSPPLAVQNCVKMTNEPPTGLQANMRRCLTLEPLSDPTFWETPPTQPTEQPLPAASRPRTSRRPPTSGAHRAQPPLKGPSGVAAAHDQHAEPAEQPPQAPDYTHEARAIKRLLFGLVFVHACVQVRV